MKSVEKMYEELQGLINDKKTDEAIAALEHLIENHPDFATAFSDLGNLYYSKGKMKKAAHCYRKAVLIDDRELIYKKNLADILSSEMGEPEEALDLYTDILKAAPDDVETLLMAGHISVLLEKFEAAKDHYDRILMIEPWHQEANTFLNKLKKEDKPESATASPYEMYQIGKAFIDSGDKEKAVSQLQQTLVQYPEFALAHNDLGAIFFQMGESRRALAHYEDAVRLAPDEVLFQKNLADLYFVETGQIEKALSIYARILEENPKDVEAILVAGHISMALEKYEDATVFYERVLDLEPWNFEAEEYLEKIQELQNSDMVI